jgi:hypothetical protein
MQRIVTLTVPSTHGALGIALVVVAHVSEAQMVNGTGVYATEKLCNHPVLASIAIRSTC